MNLMSLLRKAIDNDERERVVMILARVGVFSLPWAKLEANSADNVLDEYMVRLKSPFGEFYVGKEKGWCDGLPVFCMEDLKYIDRLLGGSGG